MALLLPPTADGCARGGALLRAGRLVAFPTETVYGLGACALDEVAVRAIFAAKGRPLTDPLIVHLPDTEEALRWLTLPPAATTVARALAARFWPGPLTLVGRAVPSIPRVVTAGTGFLGVRVPAHALARALLAAAGVPVAAPSANRFGHVSPTTAAHVLHDLGEGVEPPIAVLMGEGEGMEEAGGGVDGWVPGGEGGVGGVGAPAAGRGAGARASDSQPPTCAVGIESTVVKVEEVVGGEDEEEEGGSGGEGWEEAGERGPGAGARGDGGATGTPLRPPPSAAAAPPLTGAALALSRVRVTVYRRGGVSGDELAAVLHELAAAAGRPDMRVPVRYRTLHDATPLPALGSGAPPIGAAPTGGAAAATGAAGGCAPAAAVDASAAGGGGYGGGGEVVGGAEAPGMLLTHYAPAGVDTMLVSRVVLPPAPAPAPAPAAAAAAAPAPAASDAGTTTTSRGLDSAGAPATLVVPASALLTAVVIDVGGLLRGARATALAYTDLSASGDVLEARARVFAALRWAEGVPGAATVLLADPAAGLAAGAPGAAHGDALRDRMYRAASGRVVALALPGV